MNELPDPGRFMRWTRLGAPSRFTQSNPPSTSLAVGVAHPHVVIVVETLATHYYTAWPGNTPYIFNPETQCQSTRDGLPLVSKFFQVFSPLKLTLLSRQIYNHKHLCCRPQNQPASYAIPRQQLSRFSLPHSPYTSLKRHNKNLSTKELISFNQ